MDSGVVKKRIISELESALGQTELKPEAIRKIMSSIVARQRRRILVRFIVALLSAGIVGGTF